jgi:CRISPR/Cas system-associated exonuclease Cas4 (RecB family)
LAVYNLAEDIKGDVNKDKSALEKSADVTLDTAKNAEEFAVDGEIIGTSLALAPETMGVSLVVGLGAVIVNDLVAEHITEYAKEKIPTVGATVQKTAKKVWNFLKSPF